MDDLEHQRQMRLKRDAFLNTPNCPDCLHRMDPAEADGEPVWRCHVCNLNRSAD